MREGERYKFHLTRACGGCLGLQYKRKEQKKSGRSRSSSTTYAHSATGQTLVKRNPFYWMIYGGGVRAPGPVEISSLAHTGTRIQGGELLSTRLRLPSVKAAWWPQRHLTRVERGTGHERLGSRFHGNRWGIGSVNVTLSNRRYAVLIEPTVVSRSARTAVRRAWPCSLEIAPVALAVPRGRQPSRTHAQRSSSVAVMRRGLQQRISV